MKKTKEECFNSTSGSVLSVSLRIPFKAVHSNLSLFTLNHPKDGEGNVFTFLSIHIGGGTPVSGLRSLPGGTSPWSPVPSGGVPQSLVLGPRSFKGEQYTVSDPSSLLQGYLGYPFPSQDRHTSWQGYGYPRDKGIPSAQDRGIPHQHRGTPPCTQPG